MKGKTVAIIVILAALISGGAIAATLLTSGSDDADTRSLIPENAFLYFEASRELSDEQRAACDALADSFPEGSDCTSIGEKAREAIDKGFEEAKEDYTFEEDIEPWLGNDFTLFMTSDDLTTMIQQSQEQPTFEADATEADFQAEMEEAAENAVVPTFAVLVTVDDEDLAEDFTLEVVDKQEADFETKTYEGTDYYVENEGAWGLIDGHLVVGSENGMKAVIDQSEGDSSIEDNERFNDAIAAVRDDRLGMAYADLRPVFDAFSKQLPEGFPPGLLQAFDDVVERPITASAWLEEDSGVIEMTSNGALHDLFGYPTPGSGGQDALGRIPAGAWGAAAVDDVAGQVNMVLQMAGTAFPGGSVVLEQQFKQATGLDLQEDVLSWMGPAAMFVGGESTSQIYGGATIETSDPTKTAETILRIERLLAREGTPTRLIQRAGFRGFMAKEPGQPQAGIVAVDDERAVILIGSPELLDELAEGETLESSGRLAEIHDVLGDDLALGSYIDIDVVREMIESTVPADQEYTDTIRPFLEPLDLFVFGSAREDGVARDRYVVNVDE